uniref:Uncharacterized protein n=1 Tax=Chlamydomonas euryale TaxID=1486919 RepID=A0A7R9YSX9_9CHLO|mmetsp:Transcript_21859/g.65388  ORF Transcript_21859/g.65388 Transcript_21859/m.65388 type:complete len:156 (+) Transcript_21859:1542-2009(+)
MTPQGCRCGRKRDADAAAGETASARTRQAAVAPVQTRIRTPSIKPQSHVTQQRLPAAVMYAALATDVPTSPRNVCASATTAARPSRRSGNTARQQGLCRATRATCASATPISWHCLAARTVQHRQQQHPHTAHWLPVCGAWRKSAKLRLNCSSQL